MVRAPRPLLAGNWKMNGLSSSLGEIEKVLAALPAQGPELVLCVPATLLDRAAGMARGHALSIGAQDCHANGEGAHTGDLSAGMLRDAGATHIIVGHSERRTDHGETDDGVADKAHAVWRAGMTAIICIGETRAEREEGATLDVLSRQIEGSVPADADPDRTVIAYEPVWAIGTGLTPGVEDVDAAHRHIRKTLATHLGRDPKEFRLLYGGSVKAQNAGALIAIDDVDGALVGGASLKASDFLAIAEAFGAPARL